jgi:enoyl-CoA hydratase/carnithine racemase
MTDMMLTGRVFDAAGAQAIGLIHYLAPEGQAVAQATELAEQIAANAPLSNFAVMHALPRIAEQSQDDGLFTESLMAAIAQSDGEAKARMQAFVAGKAAKVKKS